MSEQTDISVLLQQGIDASRAGERAKARALFEEVVERDERSEKGWFWLASVVDSDEERKICLNNVLRLNPTNERARTALTALESRQKEAVAAEEVIPGINRRMLTLLIGGALAIIGILLVIALTATANNTRQQADRENTETAVAMAITDSANTATALAIAATETQAALATPTLAFTLTPNIATLPPVWTPAPTATLPATAAPLAPVTGLNGVLAVWGGRDVQAVGFVDIGYYNFDINGTYTRIPVDYVREPSFYPNGQSVVYLRYDSLLFDSLIEAANLNGGDIESVAERFRSYLTVLSPAVPSYARNGRTMVFTGLPVNGSQTPQIFLLSLDPLPPPPTDGSTAPSPIRQLSNDSATYANARISPDGTRVVAERSDENGTDIVWFDIASGSFFPITNDQRTNIETQPRYTLDGSQIIYASAVATDPDNYDIYIKSADGNGSSSPLVREPGNDRYPVISPDNTSLAYASDRGGNWDIYILTIPTNETQQLTNSQYDDYPSDWWDDGA